MANVDYQFPHCWRFEGTGITSEKNPFQRGTLFVFHLCKPISLERGTQRERNRTVG